MEGFECGNQGPANANIFPASWKEFRDCILAPGVSIIEWDIPSDTLLYSKNQNDGRQYLCSDITAFRNSTNGIHTDDIPVIRALVKKIEQGWQYTAAEFRIFCEDAGYSWYRLHIVTLRDSKGRLSRAVGQIANIDQEMNTIDKLRFKAETDALTGVLNREQTEIQIKRHLRGNQGELCALLVIDTDNFKQINDTKGHMLGDVVLSEMASAMKRAVRGEDIVGRIGGDEFVIFLKNIKSEDTVKKRAERLQQEFRAMFQNEKLSLKITCSIGIALSPNDGTEYKELFAHADQALYQSKTLGKDRYHLYNAHEQGNLFKQEQSFLRTEIDSDCMRTTLKNDFLANIFKLLYQTEDTDLAINMILEVVGKRFDVSRAYVFENSEDGRFSSNTYEWCNTGIRPEKDNLQNIDYTTLGNYESLYDENSIFYCRDITKLKAEQVALFQAQNIHSVLQCAFWKGRKFAGFIGFDECTGLRLWTQEEVDVLSLISQMMTTFIQRRRAMEWNTEMEEQIRMILDAQESCLYVIDQNTYEILYLGQKTKSLNPGIQLGAFCYKALFGKSGPCDFCPLINGGTGEADIPGCELHIKTYASSMKWLGNDAYLLSYTAETSFNREDEGQSEEKDIVDCIQWLSSREYMEDAIDYVLGVINNYYKADRVYIIEMDTVNRVANNTYEICSEGVTSQIDIIKNIPFENISFWVEQFMAKGYIKIDDIEELGEDRRGEYEILKPQGITSLMAIPLYVKGGMSGFLGMDNPKVHKKNFHYLKGLCYFLENEIAKNAMQKKFRQMSYTDSLTGLENRNSYMELCDAYFEQMPVPTGVVFMNINGLKLLNNAKGHIYGDMMIQHISVKMNAFFAAERKFRLSGDEFLIVTGSMDYDTFCRNAEAMKESLREEGRSIVSFGTAWSDGETDLSALVQKAERLMYINKAEYYKQTEGIACKKMPLLRELAESIRDKEYFVYLQPKLNVGTGWIDSAEVLIRLREKNGAITSPAKFIPMLESEGLISEIDFFVMDEVCRLLSKWKNTKLKNLRMALNFSRITLCEDTFFEQFWNVFNRYNLEPGQLEIEVTETQETLNKKHMIRLLRKLKEHGFSIALDDFGIGYSSYDFLMMADFNLMKIDKEIVQKLGEAPKADILLKHIVDMSHSLDVLCCAEGVEKREQYEYLKEIGCDYIQGYLIGKPVSVEQFEADLRTLDVKQQSLIQL